MSLLILAHDASWATRFQISSLTASATAEGDAVTLVLFFAALKAWVEERWDEPDADGVVPAARLERLDFPPLSRLLADGRERGSLRILACSASARLLALPLESVQARVDAVAGWTTFARLIQELDRVVTF